MIKKSLLPCIICGRHYDEFDPKRAEMPFDADNFCSQNCYNKYKTIQEEYYNRQRANKENLNSKLKRCPCCGSNAEILNHERDDPEIGMDFGVYNIKCINCNIQTEKVEKNEIEKAIKQWNTRT